VRDFGAGIAAGLWGLSRRLRAEHRVEHSPLVRLLRPRHL